MSNKTHGRGKLGDATKETLATFGSYTGGWNDDQSRFIYITNSWLLRGGNYSNGTGAGVFYFYHGKGGSGESYSTRAVLVK